MASWKVQFYVDARGRDPVADHMRALSAKQRATCCET